MQSFVYDEKGISCWLGGLKRLLVEMGIFSTTHNFLHDGVIPDGAAAIMKIMNGESEVLLFRG